MSGRGAQKLKRICALTGAWLSRLLRPTAREGMSCPRSLFPPFPLFPKDLNRHTNQGSEEEDPETNFVGVANCGLTNVNRYRQTKQNQKKSLLFERGGEGLEGQVRKVNAESLLLSPRSIHLLWSPSSDRVCPVLSGSRIPPISHANTGTAQYSYSLG